VTFEEALKKDCGNKGLSSQQVRLLGSHYDLLVRWNRTLNLTNVRSLADIISLHYCECLFLGRILPPGILRIADVGSGAGFPGIPVAVTRPESKVCLIESHRRKAVFLRESTRCVHNATVFAGRAEDVPERFDWMVSRAVNPKAMFSLSIAPQIALLLSYTSLSELPDPIEVIPVPGSRRRIIALFHVEHAKINGRG